jgi:hypothetical protein
VYATRIEGTTLNKTLLTAAGVAGACAACCAVPLATPLLVGALAGGLGLLWDWMPDWGMLLAAEAAIAAGGLAATALVLWLARARRQARTAACHCGPHRNFRPNAELRRSET